MGNDRKKIIILLIVLSNEPLSEESFRYNHKGAYAPDRKITPMEECLHFDIGVIFCQKHDSAMIISENFRVWLVLKKLTNQTTKDNDFLGHGRCL